MDTLPHQVRGSEEIDRIREVVSRRTLPYFVTGFDVRLGEFADTPAMWIVFKTIGDESATEDELRARVKSRLELKEAILDDLLNAVDDRWPYFRFERT